MPIDLGLLRESMGDDPIKKMAILVIIPAYNEAENIMRVIDSLYAENPDWEIVVINDGSQDRTGDIARATGKAWVIDLPCNLGIGGAVQTGFKFAKTHQYDIAVQFDGDGQHKASEIPKLLAPILEDEADVVIGSRFCHTHDGWKSTWLRRVGIKIFEVVNFLFVQQHITDNTSGFRAYNRKSLCFLAEHYPTDYPEPEVVILLGKHHFRIKEVQIVMQSRQGGKSSIAGWRSIYYMLKVLFAILINAVRPKIITHEGEDHDKQ